MSPFAAQYAQPGSFGTKGVGGGVGGGSGSTNPFNLEDVPWGTGDYPTEDDAFGQPPEVIIAGDKNPTPSGGVYDIGDIVNTGGIPMPKPVPPGTQITGGWIAPNINYVPSWMQQFMGGGGASGYNNQGGVSSGSTGSNQGSTGTSGTF